MCFQIQPVYHRYIKGGQLLCRPDSVGGSLHVDIGKDQPVGGRIVGSQFCVSKIGEKYLQLTIDEGNVVMGMITISRIVIDLQAILMEELPLAETVAGYDVVSTDGLPMVKWIGYAAANIDIGNSGGPEMDLDFGSLQATSNFTIITEPSFDFTLTGLTLSGSFKKDFGNGTLVLEGGVQGFTYPCVRRIAAFGAAEVRIGKVVNIEGLEFAAMIYCPGIPYADRDGKVIEFTAQTTAPVVITVGGASLTLTDARVDVLAVGAEVDLANRWGCISIDPWFKSACL